MWRVSHGVCTRLAGMYVRMYAVSRGACRIKQHAISCDLDPAADAGVTILRHGGEEVVLDLKIEIRHPPARVRKVLA